MGRELRNKVLEWRDKHRECPYLTHTGRCKIRRGKDCNQKNCNLLHRLGGLKIKVFSFKFENKPQHTILRRDVLRWFNLFILDYQMKTHLIITRKDWEKLNKVPEEEKPLTALTLFRKRFKNKLIILKRG